MGELLIKLLITSPSTLASTIFKISATAGENRGAAALCAGELSEPPTVTALAVTEAAAAKSRANAPANSPPGRNLGIPHIFTCLARFGIFRERPAGQPTSTIILFAALSRAT